VFSQWTDLFLAVLYKESAIGIWVTVCEDVSDNTVVQQTQSFFTQIISRSLGENYFQSLLLYCKIKPRRGRPELYVGLL